MKDLASKTLHLPLYIGGEWVDTEVHDEIRSPTDGSLVGTAARGGREEMERAIAAAKSAHEQGDWRNMDPNERADILEAISERMNEHLEELCDLHVRENGVTIRAAIAFHVGYSISHLRYFADCARAYEFEKSGPMLQFPTLAAGLVRKEPVGVCGAIVPWNFPLLLSIWKIGPALAAGNTMVVKADEKTPLIMLKFAEIAHECGLPPGVLNIVTGPGEVVGAQLAEHPDVRKIAFTGSTAVGKLIQKAAADNVKKVTLELGGKGPNIVLEDADLKEAVDGTLFAFLVYSGQACESGTRLLLHDAIYDEFMTALVARAKTVRMGDPLDFDTDMGPIISAEQKARIESYIEKGKAEGATLVLGGGTAESVAGGYWIEPTIFTDVTNDMTIAQEEIFGPVLSVIRIHSDEEAIAIANDTEYGLSAGVWTTDTDRGIDIARKIESGTVWVNDWHMVNHLYPFGGYKQSGLGRELGPGALDEYTETKFIHADMTRNLDAHIFDVVVSAPWGSESDA
jgi:betaine-aldehyde dehydrogenase